MGWQLSGVCVVSFNYVCINMIWKGAYLWNQVMLFTLSQIVDGSLLGHRRIFFFRSLLGGRDLKMVLCLSISGIHVVEGENQLPQVVRSLISRWIQCSVWYSLPPNKEM